MPISFRSAVLGFAVFSFLPFAARAQTTATPQGTSAEHVATAADSNGIREAAMDYIQGWYEGNADRMQRALHPELAKRIIRSDPKTGRSMIQTMGALTL
ncbi:MAG TPA: nuclear transport factor 2 family protein, partial [Gemmatimonadaceae bacterium]|nr:nuclear transport factor 2 family protein [Gemmatimonadaceae bacterium]